MPSLTIQNSQIEETLRSSLSGGRPEQTLAEILVSQSRAVLHKKIAFVEAQVQSCSHHDTVKTKYVLVKMNEQMGKKNPAVLLNGDYKKGPEDDGLPQPKVVLYSGESLTLGWKQPVRLGTGLSNMGNTCFCNATLQCLIYTPPLFYYLINKTHHGDCRLHHFCMLCVMEDVVRNVLNKSGGVYQPLPVVRNFKAISKHFTLGRQEDAHEFLRYVIDNMTKSLLFGKPKLDSFSKNTTAIHQIFSGYLRSQVRCKNCDFKSNTFDPFFDIALDIKEASNVYKALEHFTKGEFLSGENSYLCEKCKRRVNAVKRFSIHKVPNVLTLQLKRFDAVRLTKINRDVQFPQTLNIRAFMSIKQGDPVQFQLYGVLVHQGFSTSSGHYYSFVKSSTGQWLKMDDNRVHKVSQDLVLRQNAYILFYSRTGQGKKPLLQSPVIGPQLPQSYQQKKVANGPLSNPGLHPGTPIPRKLVTPSSTISRPVTPGNVVTNSNKGPVTPATTKLTSYLQKPGQPSATVPKSPSVPLSKLTSLDQRNKVSFGINLMKPRIVENKERKTENGKIVLKIKHGKVVSNTASPPDKLANGGGSTASTHIHNKSTGKSPVNGNRAKPDTTPLSGLGQGGVKHRLVPYLEGESSESEAEVIKDKAVNCRSQGAVVKRPENNCGSSPPTVNGKDGTKGTKTRRPSQTFEPVLDEQLKTTTEVPGAYAPLDKEKCNGFKSLSPTLQHKGLSVKISSSPDTKVNSTSKWTVFEQDQKSPSIASSNSSVGSTSGWNVSGSVCKEGGKERREEERGRHGNGAPHHSSKENSSPKKKPEKGSIRTEGGSENGQEVKYSVKPEQTRHLPEQVTSSSQKGAGNCVEGLKEKIIKKARTTIHSVQTDEGNETQPTVKKVRAEDHRKTVTLEQGESAPSKERSGEQRVSEHRESTQEENHVDTSDTQPLLDSEIPSAKKHKKKKKKHKRDSEQDKMAVFEYSSENEAQLGKKKKKKHKKKKRKSREDEQGLLSEEETPVKRAKAVEQEVRSHDRGRDYNSSTSEEFQWVERTKETIEKEQFTHHRSVPVRQWDQGVKDLKKSEQSEERHKQQDRQARDKWDGTRNHGDTLKELYKESLQGYGASVSSWDGGKSTIDQEVIHERRKEKKRHWEDEYEEDLDRGKVRKLKKSNKERFSGKVNYFQKFQEHNSKESQARNLFDVFSSTNGKMLSLTERRHGDTSVKPPHHEHLSNGTNDWGSKAQHNGKEWREHASHHGGNRDRHMSHKH